MTRRNQRPVRPPVDESVDGERADAVSLPAETLPVDGDTEAAPLALDQVSKRYGRVTAIEQASFRVRPGEFHCLAGPNGSGKTTLGRVALGLTRPTAGTVSGPMDDIGYAFQLPRYYPALTVRENVDTFRRAMAGSISDEWVDSLFRLLRLDRVAHQPASELSGGFEKKLEIAIALLDAPTYLWLDEPLADLDAISVSRVVSLLEGYVEAGGGVVVSTHNFEEFGDAFTHLTVFLDGTHGPTRDVAPEMDDVTELYHEELAGLLDQG